MNRENRYQVLDLRNKLIISLLIYQGLNISELTRIQQKDVDLEKGTLYVKGSRKLESRTLPLKSNQIILIHKYIETSRRDLIREDIVTNTLLITHRGTSESVDSINGMLEPLKALYPDRILNATTIRQSVIANLLNEFKKPLEYVQLYSGHKWLSATEQYRRKDIDEQRAKINMFHPLNKSNQ